MGEGLEGHGGDDAAPAGSLEIAIERLEVALAALDAACIPLASAYVDLAMTLCLRERERRLAER